MTNFFLAEMITHISRLPIAKSYWPDQLMWEMNCTKTVKLKDIYSLLSFDGHINQLNINWIWKLQVPPRV